MNSRRERNPTKKLNNNRNYYLFRCIYTLTVRILTLFFHCLLEDRVLHKGARVAALLGIRLRIQDYEKVQSSGQDISFLAVKG